MDNDDRERVARLLKRHDIDFDSEEHPVFAACLKQMAVERGVSDPTVWKKIVEEDAVKRSHVGALARNIIRTTLFACSRCKSRDTAYFELQMRAGDEGSTVFVTCMSCAHHWRIGG